ncbi:MAG: Phosphoglucomutase [Elusimicrobia bacterium ADurb.Bin231]|nr:MAG: Phosphoglucomutase [Elusimicrobia bacterium ADurb.Bin231]
MIKFGTSGWRGIIADDFTFDNVRIVTQAIADYVKETSRKSAVRGKKQYRQSVVVGYDTRFHSENFARISAEVLAGNGIEVLFTKRDCPTPVIAFEILRVKSAGGINFTASHNPPEYNGLKFSPSWGGPALPETTTAIEKKCIMLQTSPAKNKIKMMPYEQAVNKGLISEIEPEKRYLKRIRELVDLKAIKKAKLKIVCDVLYGTGKGYLDALLEESGCETRILHNYRNVLFGGHSPEPNKANLSELLSILKKEKYNLGLGTDGDADRFGIIDADGSFITPNDTIALLFDHLVRTRKWKGVVARSVMTTHLIDAVAKMHGVQVRETPVGFKYIGEVMTKENMIIGGEESGGLTIMGHVPEKDGILACLLVAELVAANGKPIKEILKDLYNRVGGAIMSTRLNFHMPMEKMNKIKEKLSKNPPSSIASLKVKEIVTIDGYKFLLENGSWVGLRLSGTEPVIRIYVEASSKKRIDVLAQASKKFLAS